MTVSGGLVGYIISLILTSMLSIFLPFSISIDIVTFSIALMISISIGLVFSYFPAKAAGKKEIISII
ncbi:MAG: hypothetical protein L0J63_13110 [Tetragenococcus koreensis]|nr:hypothetical protein [Tetragenococcus koreensis]